MLITVLEDSILVKIHQAPAEVPPNGQGGNVEDEQEGQGGQEIICPV